MILFFGILNLILLLWQLATGLHVIKISYKTHRKTGIALVISALIHAGLALLA